MSHPTDYRRALRPPQFTLRTLLALITLLAVLFALVNVIHPLVLSGLILLVLLIAGHVAGNAIGTRLREIGSRPVTRDGRDISPGPFGPQVAEQDYAPPTQLGRRLSLGLMVVIVTSIGALVGALSGGLWGYLAAGSDGWLNIVVGAVAFGFLGGFCSFAAFSFSQVLLGAFWQAVRSAEPTRRAPNGPVYPL